MSSISLDEVAQNIVHRWDIFNAAQTIVDEKFEDGRELAKDALATATQTINELKAVASELHSIDVSAVMPHITPPDVGTFAGVAPTAPSLDINFPAAPTSTDEMEAAIHDKLISDIQNSSPAVTDDVQDAIFKKDSERQELILDETIDKLRDEWAKTGFTLPNAILSAAISQAIIENKNKRSDISRDIAIKTFELSEANMKFAVQQGITFLLQRIEVYKGEIQAEAARIDAIVRKYLGEVSAYQGTAQVYTALADVNIKKFDAEIRYEVSRADLLIKNAEIDIENFRVLNGQKLEAMKSIGAINAQMVAGSLSSVSASANISASNSAAYAYDPNDAA